MTRRPASLLMLFAATLPMSGGVAAGVVPRTTARPLRVMSLNECTDQIVLALLPPARISSVTWLSRDPQTSQMARAASRVAVNHGLGEEVLRAAPDLVITGTYTTAAPTRQMLKSLGWPTIEVASTDSIDQIRSTTRLIARAVGEPARGEALLARMDRQIAELARHPGPPLRVAAWDGSGFSAARGSLYDTVLTMAGATNIAADPAVTRTGVPDTELLLAAAPALLVRGGADSHGALRAAVTDNPIVLRYWGGDRTLPIRQAYYLCGTPFVADEAMRLRGELRAAAGAAHTPLPFGPRPSR